MKKGAALSAAEADLVEIYSRGGCLRRPSARRLQAESAQEYKKGSEVRLVAASPAELRRIRGLLETADFKPGHPYGKGKRFVQPIYGEEQVLRFCGLLEGETGASRGNRVKPVTRPAARRNARTLRGAERYEGDDRTEVPTYSLLGLRLVERQH